MHECHVYRLRSRKMATVSRPRCGLGPFCGEAGLSEQDLLKNNVENTPRLSQSTLLVNGILYELGLFRKRQNIRWNVMQQWITRLCENFLPFVTFNETNLRMSVDRLIKKVSGMISS